MANFKTFLLLLISCLMSLGIYAQTEHLKFMGIPLTGNIASFQSKLQAKGITYNKKVSSQLKSGCRVFNGTFSGEKADFYVYYNEKTKIVYRAKAVITCQNEEICEHTYSEFDSMLRTKYSEHVATNGEQNNHPSLSILVTDSKIERTLGYIGMYITNPPYSFMDERYLHIDYEDVTNEINNTSRNMDDL